MNNKYIYILFIIGIVFFTSCSEDSLDPQSIFDTNSPERNEFDVWLLKNFVDVYNVDFKYRYEDVESDQTYNLVPADYAKSVKMAKLVKYLWYEAYDELLQNKDFMRTYGPRVIVLIGSPAYRPSSNTRVMGVAEGGLKVTLLNINVFDEYDIELLNEEYFRTIHHEFAHILHQTKNYPTDFNLISAGNYTPASWGDRSRETSLKLGFITSYAGSEHQEDFVEIIANFITHDDDYWNESLAIAGAEGAAKIEQKFEIVKNYLRDSWGIDIYELREIVQRRSNSILDLDFETL